MAFAGLPFPCPQLLPHDLDVVHYGHHREINNPPLLLVLQQKKRNAVLQVKSLEEFTSPLRAF